MAGDDNDPFRTGAKNPLKTKLLELEADIDKAEKAIQPKKDKLRANPNDTALRAEVVASNQQVAIWRNEAGEMARAISIMLGGKQHQAPIG